MHHKIRLASHKITACFFTAAFLLTGCEKWLNVTPKDKVPEDVLFTSEQGYIDALNGVYLNMDRSTATGLTNGFYTNHMTTGLLTGLGYGYDNCNASTLTSSSYMNAAYVFDYNFPALSNELLKMWKTFYVNVANLNNILKQIDANKSVFTSDNFNRVKGESIALRAFHLFDVTRLWGQPPTIAGGTPAIPYVTKFDILTTPLSPVNEALNLCLEDLRVAKNLLATSDTSTLYMGTPDLFKAYTQNHLNYWAVKALMARVFLYQGNIDSANIYAAEVIGSGKFPLITTNVASPSLPMRDRTFAQEHVFALYGKGLTTAITYNFLSNTPLQLSTAGRTKVYATPSTDATDWRLNSWFEIAGNFTVPSKFLQDANLKYEWQHIMPLLRISEMYYIASECAARKGDVTTGLQYLNKVRNARGLSNINNNITPDSLRNATGREYQKEFIAEGQTFFYYKRLNLDFQAASGYPLATPSTMYTFPLPDLEKEYRQN